MKLGHTNDEIKFDVTISTLTRFVVILDGEPSMHILCDTSDPDRVIHIANVKGGAMLATLGTFAVESEILSDADGAPLGVSEPRVSSKSVYTYVIPRLHVLLARLLCAAG